MKILRILRRRKIKLSFIFLLLLVFIVNTYAWMSTDKNTTAGNITLNVSSWEVAFIIDDEEKTEEYTFEIEEFYPGITPIEKKIEVWNIGDSNSFLEYEITEIYLYGVQILKNPIDAQTSIPETIGTETTNGQGQKTADLFGNEDATIFDENNTYYNFLQQENVNEAENIYKRFSLRYPTPFTISYAYGLTHIEGAGRENQLGSRSEMVINLEWTNDEDNNEEDTKLGNLVYDFENAKDKNGNLLYENEPALKIVAKVTARKDMESDNTYSNDNHM